MKAVSLWQPWATLVALNEKLIETRGWPTNYRGPLAIHAAKKYDNELGDIAWLTEPFRSVLHRHGLTDLPRGCVIATCDLVGCVGITGREKSFAVADRSERWEMTEQERAFGRYEPGRYAWLLANIVPLPQPIPARGGQRIFNWNKPGKNGGLQPVPGKAPAEVIKLLEVAQ